MDDIKNHREIRIYDKGVPLIKENILLIVWKLCSTESVRISERF